MEQLRKHKRMAFDATVQVTFMDVPGHSELSSETFLCTSLDLSEGGVCLTIEAEVPVGTPLRLKIFRNRPLKSFLHDAVIRWTREIGPTEGWQIGIGITGIPPADQKEWQEFVEALQKAGG